MCGVRVTGAHIFIILICWGKGGQPKVGSACLRTMLFSTTLWHILASDSPIFPYTVRTAGSRQHCSSRHTALSVGHLCRQRIVRVSTRVFRPISKSAQNRFFFYFLFIKKVESTRVQIIVRVKRLLLFLFNF